MVKKHKKRVLSMRVIGHMLLVPFIITGEEFAIDPSLRVHEAK